MGKSNSSGKVGEKASLSKGSQAFQPRSMPAFQAISDEEGLKEGNRG